MSSLNDIQAKVMDEAIDCIPMMQKQAYIEAMEKDPCFVCSETDPSYYLSFEQFDAWKAAQRLVCYWNWKKKIFGERTFRSIFDLSGNGALDDDDIDLLRTGYAVKLSKDIQGNSIFLFDRSRTRTDWEHIDHFQCVRVLFYFCALMADEQKESGTGTAIVLNIIRSLPKNIHNMNDFAHVSGDIMPLRPKVHSLLLTKVSFASFFMQLVMPAVERNVSRYFPFSLSLCFSESEALEKLAYLGLPPSSFPVSLGGTWKYESFLSWLDSQASTRWSCDTNPWWNESDSDSQQLAHLPHESLHMSYENIDCTCNNSHGAITYTNKTNLRLSGDVPNNDLNRVLNYYHPLTEVSKDLIYNSCPSNQDSMSHNNVRQEQTLASERINSINSNECSIFTLRCKLFGEQAYCHKDQTELLSPEDIVTLDTGFLIILPIDKNGNAVVQLEISKAKTCSCESQRRCCFYICSILSQQQSMCQPPIDIIVLAFMNDIEQNQFQYEMTFVDIIEIFQINVSHVHVFYQEVGLGWFAYQHDAQTILEKLLQIKSDDNMTTIHTLNENDVFNIDAFCVVYNFDRNSLFKILDERTSSTTQTSLDKECQNNQVLIENSIIPKTVNSPVMMEKLGSTLFNNNANLTEGQDNVILDNNQYHHRKPEQKSSSEYPPYLIDVVPSLVLGEDNKDEFFSTCLLHDDLLDDLFDDMIDMSIHSGIFNS